MAGRYTKKQPEFVYFWGEGEWIQGPYVNPQKGRDCRKYKLVEFTEKTYTAEDIYDALRDYPIDANLKKLNSIERSDIIREWVKAHFKQ